MRITDFQVSNWRRKRETWKQRLFFAVVLKLDDAIVQIDVRRVAAEERNIAHLRLRRRHIQACNFNIKRYFEQQYLIEFRFKCTDIAMLCNRFEWPGVKYRNEYCVAPLTRMCVFLHRMSTQTRCFDLEKKFGLFASQLLKLFWRHEELCVETYGYNLELHANLIRPRAAHSASTLVENRSPLELLIAFIDCTKIRIASPGGANCNQQSVCSGHKRKHCLIYQTVSTLDGMIAGLHGHVEGFCHDPKVLQHSDWEELFSEMCVIDGRKFYIYGDSAYLL